MTPASLILAGAALSAPVFFLLGVLAHGRAVADHLERLKAGAYAAGFTSGQLNLHERRATIYELKPTTRAGTR